MRAPFFAFFLLAFASTAGAQPGSSYAEIRYVGETPVEVVVDRRVRVVATGRTKAVPGSNGASAYAGTSDDGVLLALVGRDSLRAVFVPVGADGLGNPSAARRIERPAARGHSPVGAAIAPMPDGFALFWQEADDTNAGAAYQTFVQRLGPTGEPSGEPQAVQAVWPLAAAAYMPETNRFYFLLFYGGGDPRQTRLCGVHIDATTLRPQEHPWWASRPGLIDEGQLFVRGNQVLALYRGGPEGDQLLEVDVSQGGWAQEAAEPTARGALGGAGVFGARLQGDRLRVLIRPGPSR